MDYAKLLGRLQTSRFVPFILTGYCSRSHFPRTAGYIRGTTRVPSRADSVSAAKDWMPTQHYYIINETTLESCDTEKADGMWVSSNLTCTSEKKVIEQCAKANKTPWLCAPSFWGHPKHPNASHTLSFYRPVPPQLSYPSMVATVNWLTKANVQHRATKLILKLPFRCHVTCKSRLQLANL